MKGFLILEEFEQIVYEDTQECFEQLQPYVERPALELMPGSGLYRVKDGEENTAFYVLQVTMPEMMIEEQIVKAYDPLFEHSESA